MNIVVVREPVPAKTVVANIGPKGDQGDQGVPGTASYTVTKYAANATLPFVPQVALVDASVTPVVITLPAPTGALYTINVKKTDLTANIVTVDGGGNNIDDLAQQLINSPKTSIALATDGTEWFII